jgi:hypothetical protein
MFVPSLTCDPSLAYVPSSLPKFSISDPILVSYLVDENEDGNPPPPTHLHPIDFVTPQARVTKEIMFEAHR